MTATPAAVALPGEGHLRGTLAALRTQNPELVRLAPRVHLPDRLELKDAWRRALEARAPGHFDFTPAGALDMAMEQIADLVQRSILAFTCELGHEPADVLDYPRPRSSRSTTAADHRRRGENRP